MRSLRNYELFFHFTLNSVQLAQKLEQERSIKLSPDWLKRVLKKRGLLGNVRERAINVVTLINSWRICPKIRTSFAIAIKERNATAQILLPLLPCEVAC